MDDENRYMELNTEEMKICIGDEIWYFIQNGQYPEFIKYLKEHHINTNRILDAIKQKIIEHENLKHPKIVFG